MAARKSFTATAQVVRARLSTLRFTGADRGDLPDLETLEASAKKFGLDLKSRSTSAWPGSMR